MAPRKQKRQDDSTTRPLQAPHAPVAEAIAIGAAAGGLVLGTMQAQGAVPDAGDQLSILTKKVAASDDSPLDKAQAAPPDDGQPHASIAVPAAPIEAAEPVQQVDATRAAPFQQPVAMQEADTAELAKSVAAPVQSQLVSDLSEQMTATLAKVIGSVEPGQSLPDIGQSIVNDIIASAQQIVANLDVGSLVAETQHLSDRIIAEALGATSGIADSVLAELDALPASILGNAGLALADLPSSLLGNEGPDGSGGLFSEIFYADGASDSLDIPMLSEVASTLVSDIGNGATGLLGLSYVDVSDHQGGHGLNALSLL